MENTNKKHPIRRFFGSFKSFHFSRKHYAIPYIILLCLLVIFPLGMMIFNSFVDQLSGGFTLDNYLRFFTSVGNLLIMLRSLYTAAIVTIVCLLLAYPTAYILSNPKFNRSTTIIFVFALPMWVNILLRTIALSNLFGLIGLRPGYFAVVVGLIYDFFPFMLLPLYTALSNIDRSYTEAGADLGANPVRNFLRVTLPLSVPGIMSGGILIFMSTVSNFAISDLLGNDGTRMFGNIINNLFVNVHTENIGAAFATILLALICVSMVLTSRATRKRGVKTAGGGRL